MRGFPYLKLGIRDLKAKSGRDSGLKVYARGGMPKITLGITGLKNPIGEPQAMSLLYRTISDSFLKMSARPETRTTRSHISNILQELLAEKVWCVLYLNPHS